MAYYTNDSWAYYDLNAHRYVLKAEYMKDNYSIELISALDTTGAINAQAAVNNFLKRASRVLYSYIFQYHPAQTEYMTYKLAKDSHYRLIILEAMGELVYSWLINNNDLAIQNGVGIDAGKLYERIDARQNTVPVSVENILYNSGITWRARWTEDIEYEEDKLEKGITW